MKTTQAKVKHIFPLLAVAIALLEVTNVQATVYTAIASANWNVTSTWSPTGIPTNGDSAIIPSGKTVTIATAGNYCTNSGQSISVSGTLKYGASSTVLGDIAINSGGTLDTTINGTAWTFSGNVTNNGSMTFSGGGSTITATYTGGSSTSPKFLSGNITNSAASISGVYVNLGLFLTGQAGNQVTGISGAGTLTNLGTISYGGNATPSITKLDCATPGNLFFYRGGSGNAAAVYGTPYYNFTLDSALQGSFPTFNAGATFLGMFTNNFGGNGATLPANFTVGAFTMGSSRANNDNIAANATMWLNGAGGWIYNANKLTFNSGCTVYFTNGASGPIGGSVITPFVNLVIGSNAVVTLTNFSTVSGTLAITNGGTFNAVSNITGTGAFTLRSGGTLGVGSTAGIVSNATLGSVQLTGARTYEAGANYAYIGTAAQVTGNALTNTINTLTVSNSAGVALSGGITVTNKLIVSAGTLSLSNFSLTLGASASVFNSGTIQGSLTAGASGKVYAGTDGGYGTNIVSTNLTMTSGSTLNFDLGTVATGSNDLLIVSNTLALNSTVINLKAPSPGATIDQASDYTLITAGNITGTPTINWVTAPANSANYALIVGATSVKLHYGAAVAVGTLTFTQQPTSTGAGSTITPAVTVLVKDGSGAILTNVTVVLSVSNNAATLNGTVSQVSDATGTATFNNLSINSLGTYYLAATAGTPPTNFYSAAFTISAGTAAKLGIVTNAPGTALAGVAFTNSPTVQVLDAFGNVVSNSTASITVTNAAGTGVVQGTTTVSADGVSGLAVFTGLSLTNSGNVTLTFTANGLTSTNSTAITVSPGTPTSLSFLTLPSTTAAAGTPLAAQPVLAVKDVYGNTVTTSTAPIDVSASVGNITGPRPTNAVSGVATFTGLYLTNINNGNPITLNFTSSGLTGTNSTVTVAGGSAVALAWTTQPGGAVYGAAFGTQPVLKTVDLYGNPTTNGLSAAKTVTVSHTSGGGALVGTTSYNIGTSGSNGVITFTDLQINAAGTNNQLTAFTGNGQAPTNYAGLNLWLDASDVSSTMLNGTSVTNWTDKSGTGHSATNSAGTAPIIATNSTLAAAGASAGRVVRFNGSTTILGVTGNLTFLAGKPYTIIAMEVANNNGGTASYYIGTDPTGTDNALQIGYRNSGDFTLAQYGDDFDYTTTFTYPQARMWTCKANNGGAGGRVIYLNGTSVATSGNTAALNTPTGGYIGASFGKAEHYNGDLAEIIVYTNALTDAQRTNVETYLLNKWTTGLPGVATASFTVSPATVTIASGVTATDKLYDGNTNATLTIGTVVFSGVLPADTNNVALNSSSYTAYFANAGPGNNIPVTVSGLALSGSAATNYSLTQPTNLTANITVPITYSGYTITDGGNGNAQAGVADQLTITAVNSDGSTQSGVSGNILLAFSGLSNGSDGTSPTITDKFGTAQTLGATNTLISFTNGLSLVGGSLVPHKNETAILQVTDAAGHSSTSTGGTNLNLVVSVGTNSAYRITTTNAAPVVGTGDTLTLTMVDKYQNVNNGFASTPSITFGGLANGPDGSQPTVNGTAFGTGTPIAFSGGSASATLVAHKQESNKLLTATDGTLTAATTGGTAPTLSPSAGTAIQLGISTQPSSSAAAGVAFAQQPVLAVLDQYGNLTSSNAQVTATASVGTLQGPTVTNAVSGTVTYSGLSLTNSGTNTLVFSSPGLASTNSTVITVSGGAVTGLAWTTQPGSAVHGMLFGAQPALQTVDQFGNFSTNGLTATANVTISLSGSGILSGMTSTNIGTSGANGRAMFTNLKINGAGSGKQLIATSAGYGTPVSGMAVWLDANSSSSVTVSTGEVTAWNDLSGNGRNFATTLANGGHIYYTNNNPAFSGRKTVTFAGNYLKNTSYTNTGPNISVFVVFRTTVNSTANGTYNRPFGLWAGTAGRADYQSTGSFNYDIGPNANAVRIARNEQDCGGGADLTALNGVNLSSSYYNAEFIATGSANTLYANGGNTQTDGNCVGNFSVAAAAVGGGLSGSGGYNGGLFGDVAELLVYNTALTTTDRQTVESYLNKKWQSGSTYIASADLTATSSPFTVDPAPLSITASNQSKTYGQTVPFGSGSTAFASAGLVSGDAIDSLTLTCSGGTGAAPVSGSPYTITPSAPVGVSFSAANYSITYTNGTLTVSPAALSITASNQSKMYGQTVTFGSGSTAFTSSGLQNGETIDSVTLTCSGGTATAPVSGSPYTITPSAPIGGAFSAANYSITYTNGTLTVTAASSGLAVSSSVNPSGFGGSVTFTATVPSDASGNVIFKANGTPLGTNTVSTGTATNVTATLPRGTNIITAEYSGDGNYLAGTNALAGGQVVTNHPPVAGLMTATRLAGTTLKIALSDIATNWSDVDGDSISLTNINLTSTNGVTLSLLNVTTNNDGSYVITNNAFLGYSNTFNVADQLSYTITDGFGGTTVGYVNIVVISAVFGQGTPQIVSTNGGVQVTFYGIPNYTYIVQRNLVALSSPMDWFDFSTNTAPTNNPVIIIMDTNNPEAFYRLRWQP